MKLIQGAKLGDVPTKDLSRQRRIDRYVQNSSIVVVASPHDSETPNALHIEIHGDLAITPKLKRGRRAFNNRVVTDPVFLEKMIALDLLWNKEREGKQRINFGSTHIHIEIVISQRDTGDPQNAAQTIADWFEDRMKIKRDGKEVDRGWGLGIIDDDKHITCHALYGWQIGLQNDCTIVVVRPWEYIRESAINFHKEHYLDWGSK